MKLLYFIVWLFAGALFVLVASRMFEEKQKRATKARLAQKLE